MEFKCVEMSKLKEYKKYKIQIYINGNCETTQGIFLCSFECWNKYVCFELKDKIMNFDETTYFYEGVLKKKKIQEAMELRAVNKILQQLIGDTFTY